MQRELGFMCCFWQISCVGDICVVAPFLPAPYETSRFFPPPVCSSCTNMTGIVISLSHVPPSPCHLHMRSGEWRRHLHSSRLPHTHPSPLNGNAQRHPPHLTPPHCPHVPHGDLLLDCVLIIVASYRLGHCDIWLKRTRGCKVGKEEWAG
jgi:hypothetical protein